MLLTIKPSLQPQELSPLILCHLCLSASICSLSHCCGQNPVKQQRKGGGVECGPQFQGIRYIMAEEAWRQHEAAGHTASVVTN